jgi:hypothetical protein
MEIVGCGSLFQGGMPVIRQGELGEKLEQLMIWRHQFVGAIGLKFHRVCPCFRCCVDQPEGLIQVCIMVIADFGNYVWLCVEGNSALAD